MCGASASTSAARCDHCGARLATVACPSCFGMMFLGARFCSHCGARADRTDVGTDPSLPCPRCKAKMSAVVIGGAGLLECPRCGGIWADASSFEQICADRESQAAVLGMAAQLPEPGAGRAAETIRYVPCPRCGKLMNRVNFAHCSSVIVDVCKADGTWFDKDELRHIIEFIRAGGLEVSRSRELEELEQRKRDLEAAQAAAAREAGLGGSGSSYDDWHLSISSAGDILKLFRR